MRGILGLAIAVALLLSAGAFVFFFRKAGGGVQYPNATTTSSLYDLSTRRLDGADVSMGDYRGRVALVVNVASKCGMTPQYTGLEKLHEELAPKGFAVLGFPSNDFGGQEPGTAEEIRTFCSTTYGVTFPMFEKRTVKGAEKDAVYQFLTRGLEEPTWNFTKYLVGRDGRVRARFGPKVTPEDAELRAAIDQALAEG